MITRDDDMQQRTGAGEAAQASFGSRPAPKGHQTAGPYPHRPMRSSRIIPSTPPSSVGRRADADPSLSARLIVWGGVALGMAGLTAATLLATRKLAGTIADDPAPVSRPARPGFVAEPVAKQVTRQDARVAPRRKVARDLTRTANDLSASIDGVAKSVLGAFQGFRQVSSQANGLVREFAETADQVRTVLHGLEPRDEGAASRPREKTQDRGRAL